MIGKHKFASGIADSADTALVLASDWNADVLIGLVLTNNTGTTLTAGDVVAVDPNNNSSVILADTAGARRQYVVFVSAMPSSSGHTPGATIDDAETGIFLPVGAATVKVAGATTRGNYLRKSATSKALEDTGVAVTAAPPGDAIGSAFTSAGGAGTVSAVFRGLPVSPGGNIKSVQVFTTDDTWTRPAGIRRVLVEVVGGGGSGGGAPVTAGAGDTAGGSGGGGGGYASKLIDVSAIASATVTVGAGGAAGDGTNGAAGENSVWDDGTNTVTGAGGAGGLISTNSTAVTGGAGGVGTGGDLNIAGSGGGGAAGNSISGGDSMASGHGGSSRLGGGGRGAGSNAAGQAGGAYGGGGSGAAHGGSQGITRAGGAGADGVVAVWEFE